MYIVSRHSNVYNTILPKKGKRDTLYKEISSEIFSFDY